jgi:hypothetical protein
MTRRRFIQDPSTLELIEITADYQPDTRAGDAALWGDRHYSNTQGPNGEDLSSRSKHKAYMKATGLTTTDDYKGEWSRAKEARENYRRNGGSVSKNDIQRAIARLKGY